NIDMNFQKLPKLRKGDKVAILSPSFAAPGVWPHVYQLGLKRLKEVFELEPVEFPTTAKVGASKEERSKDLIDAFSNPEIKGIIGSLGGNDQVTYVKNLPRDVFANNPKQYFGYSDHTHFQNHLWQCGVPSYYGGMIFTQFAMQQKMHDFSVKYLKTAMFEGGEVELTSSETYNDIGLDWSDESNLDKERVMEQNDGWHWDGSGSVSGISWGGCLESLDEMHRHGITLPSLEDFESVVLFFETSEEIPPADYVHRVLRAFGERGILERVKGVMVGRPKAWEFDKQNSAEEKRVYREEQREIVIETVRKYNESVPIIQNLDFGHTEPQLCLPFGGNIRIEAESKKIFATF
nr:LD-carboxypeptidase [Candidatus Woesebacteria bacterium]